MKRYISYIFIICFCLSLIIGCTTNKNSSVYTSSGKDEVASNTKADQTNILNKSNNFRIYTNLTNSTNGFDKEILSNQIDKDYYSEFDQAITTKEFIDVQKKYIDKWKVEMLNVITQMKTILSDADFSDFKNSQNEWEKQLLDSTKSDQDIIKNSKYEIMVGSDFSWLWLSNIREQYRERTIHIKYMLYLLQNKGDIR